MNRLVGLTALLMGVAGHALGAFTAPEVDASSSVAAVALIAGGLLVLRGRSTKPKGATDSLVRLGEAVQQDK